MDAKYNTDLELSSSSVVIQPLLVNGFSHRVHEEIIYKWKKTNIASVVSWNKAQTQYPRMLIKDLSVSVFKF